jgi:hypothetical protein
MIKTNRFIRVLSRGGLPLRALLNHLRVPILAEDRTTILFPGYVLSVLLECPEWNGDAIQHTSVDTEPCSFMLLGRDMDIFCDAMMDGDVYMPGFGTKIAIEIVVGLDSSLRSVPRRDPMTGFFSDATQQRLLLPFRNRLRGFKKAKVRGRVSREIANTVEEDIAQDYATDPEVVLTDFQKQKDEGQALYKAKKMDEACLKWQDAALDIEQLRAGSSWATLTGKGGIPFVSRLAEIYFLMKLNVGHIMINAMTKSEFCTDLQAEDAMVIAMNSLKQDYWMSGNKLNPSDVHKAKLFY